jgi:hypothetical protein
VSGEGFTVTQMRTWIAVVAAAATILAPLTPAAAAQADSTGPRYTGPALLEPASTLTMATASPAAVLAATYVVDGRPVATSTVPPFSARLGPGDVRPGMHSLGLEIVTKNGERFRTPTVRVRASAPGSAAMHAAPGHGFGAATRALRRGHVTVVLEPGIYQAHDIVLGDGATLVGKPGAVLRAPAGAYSNVLFVNGRDVHIGKLTIDGGGQGAGDGEAVAIGPRARSVRASHLRIVHVRRSGLYAWGSFYDVSLQDSTVTGDGAADAGAVVGLHEGGSHPAIVRCKLRGFRQFGITFTQSAFDRLDMGAGAVALDNVVSDVDDPSRSDGTDEGGIWSGGPAAAIVGNRIARTTWDGIETVGSSVHTIVTGNRIRATRTGIYLEHATHHSLFADNVIRRVDTGINVEWRYGDVGSSDNHFLRNTITEASKAGIFVDVGSDRNALVRNRISLAAQAIVLQGASSNRVTRNVVCGSPDAISETKGLRDDGSTATPAANVIRNNTVVAAC